MIVDVIRELSMKKQEKIAKPIYIFRLTRQIKVIYFMLLVIEFNAWLISDFSKKSSVQISA